jgi:hypothetical protein
VTPEEVAAITAVTVALRQRAAGAAESGGNEDSTEPPSTWVDVSRRSAQRALLQRGPWRLSGRIHRRPRV